MVKQIYYYSIAFITLIMTISGGIVTFMNVSDYLAPTGYYYSYDQYKENQIHLPKGQQDVVDITEDELMQRYSRVVEDHISQEQQRAKNNLIKGLGWIIIPFPIFFYFQRRITKEKNGGQNHQK